MPLRYTWSRTAIAGQELAYDYSCADGERGIGRVYKHVSGGWWWGMNAWGPDTSRANWEMDGVVDSKDKAAAMVERRYDACRSG
jgi:hypothetical protein